MAASNELKTLVDQMPDPDERKMHTKNIDQAKIGKALAGIRAGGAASVRGLIELLGTPGSEGDVKPHYALHALANHILQTGDEAARREFGEVVAGALGADHSVEVKAYLCQELQWAGGTEAVSALGGLLLDEALTEAASMALVSMGEGSEAQFLKAFPGARGRSRLNILQGLGAVGGEASRGALREGLKDTDRDSRVVAGWGLARQGNPASVNDLMAAADRAEGWERIQALKHGLVLAEGLARSGKSDEAAKVYRHLGEICQDPSEAHVKEAAERGLGAFSKTPA